MSKRFPTIFKGGFLASILAFGLVYLVQFPDEPIRPCHGPGGFCGKQGQPHTAADYIRYRDWTMAHLIFVALGAIGLVIIELRKPKA